MLFVKHVWGWFLVMLCLVLSFPMLPTDGWFSVAREVEVNDAFYGMERNSRYVADAQARFQRWFVDTGAYGTTLGLAARESPSAARQPGKEFTSPNISGIFDHYVEHFWDGILRAIYRWEVNQHWYVLAIVGLCAGVNEGLAKRQINTARTLYVSPANFHLAGHFLIANVIGSLLVLPWLPIVMTWPIWIVAIAVLTRFWVWAVISLPSLKPQNLIE